MVRNLEAALPHCSLSASARGMSGRSTPSGRHIATTEVARDPSRRGVALCSIGPLTYELVESLSGPSWDDFLKERGAGMHHFGYYVDDIDGAIDAMAAKGYPRGADRCRIRCRR